MLFRSAQALIANGVGCGIGTLHRGGDLRDMRVGVIHRAQLSQNQHDCSNQSTAEGGILREFSQFDAWIVTQQS